MSKISKRQIKDISVLKSNGYLVEEDPVSGNTIYTYIEGPKDTPYEDMYYKITVYFPPDYPFKSPSVGFISKIYHPNVDFASGSVCLDVLNTTWSPMTTLFSICSIFLPQLLTYPNSKDPLNTDAAKLLDKNVEEYNLTVKKYVVEHGYSKKELKLS